jgi:serine phosphatase RsbU (regulator of sigma subunit)
MEIAKPARRGFKRQAFAWATSLNVKQKVGFIAIIAQALAFVAIGAGLVGMILSNNSIQTIHLNSLMPLEHLRASKYALEYDIIQVAKDLKEGKMGSNGGQTLDAIYGEAYKRIEHADETIKEGWGAYTASKNLTGIEKQKLPAINESMGKAFASITALKEVVQKKDLSELMDFVESEMPFMLANMTPIFDELMQLQVSRAQEMYKQSQNEFNTSLIVTILVYILGAILVHFVVRIVVNDILGATKRLVTQSEALAANKLEDPFVWTRKDELGMLGQSFELTRKELARLFRETQESHDEIAKAHENICSSINYARRIQLAFLPDEAHIRSSVSDYFIIWKPKDVIGGDCYWIERFEGGCFIAVVDCTGHGVPGALMTFVVLSLLSRTLAHDGMHRDPAALLAKMNRLIKDELGQHDDGSESNDGMDGAFIFIEGGKVIYAGANTPLMYHRVGSDEVEELRPDKSSVGYVHSDVDFVFTNHTIELEKGDRIYLCTDGITDQIGGERTLAHGKKRLKKNIINSMNLNMEEQKEYIWQHFAEYKGSQTQRDDNTMMGLEIL